MKDSGIEWVGTIPEHWNVRPLYVYFGERKNPNDRGEENNLLSLSYGRIIRKDINTNEGLLPASFNTYNIVEAGDIIIRPTDLQNDKRSLRTGLAKERGIITSAYIALHPLIPQDTRFFHYLLHSYDVTKVFYNLGSGVRQGLNFSEFSKLMVFEPPHEEQSAIADYLDAKCAEIDKVVEKTRETIEEYKKLKQSIITETVTKGLNPDAEMKDSGIPWIGKIPVEWSIERLQWHLREINHSNNPVQTRQILSLTNKLGVIPYEAKGDIGNKSKEDYSDYKLAYPDTIVVNSMNVIIGSVGISNYFGCVSPVYYVFAPKIGNSVRFLNYIFQTTGFQKELRCYANGILEIRLRVSSDKILKRGVAIPSVEEQKLIVSFLDDKCAELDSIIEKKEQLIEELGSYKKSLIYEYVTGKKEVQA